MNKTKEKILQAAINLLETGNYQTMTSANIAAKAGISEGSIYRYFKGKKEIFASVLKFYEAKIPIYLFDSINNENSLEMNFKLLTTNFFKMFKENKFFYNVIYKGFSEVQEPEIKTILQHLLQTNLDEIVSIFEFEQDKGYYKFDDDTIQFFSMAIWGVAETLIKQYVVGSRKIITQKSINKLLNPFLKLIQNYKISEDKKND